MTDTANPTPDPPWAKCSTEDQVDQVEREERGLSTPPSPVLRFGAGRNRERGARSQHTLLLLSSDLGQVGTEREERGLSTPPSPVLRSGAGTVGRDD